MIGFLGQGAHARSPHVQQVPRILGAVGNATSGSIRVDEDNLERVAWGNRRGAGHPTQEMNGCQYA